MEDTRIAIVGLGYVGLPLAVEFGKIFPTIGYDINSSRILELKNGNDSTLEVDSQELNNSKKITYTSDLNEAISCNIFIVTVPTPINKDKSPDLYPLKAASESIGGILKKGDIVIYESTVFPGATEEICVPILEKYSGLFFNQDFYCGYSPERINPGDKEHRITNIKKITSGSNEATALKVDELYNLIISAGTHRASSIKVAEAAKVIENTQRDVNIALINELSLIFDKLNIDTQEVLKAAESKWNFLPFYPGLVGGHCIGVDPYYLTFKAIEVGYQPEVILAGRRLNDRMGEYVADRVARLMKLKSIPIIEANILILGFSFKENCPDIRNTRVVDLVKKFLSYDCNVDVYDPWINSEDAIKEFSIEPVTAIANGKYDAIVLAVAHDIFKNMTEKQLRLAGKENHILFDVKYLKNSSEVDGRL
jgi:UDP-N-acetyl-D-glucosamine/UDP-N-acetyl-D-galactosamine dehydrogenase